MWQYNDWIMGHHWIWFMPFGGFWFLILLVVLFVVLFVRSPHRGAAAHRSAALDILEQRYARGEIGREEYLEKKADLAGKAKP